MVNTTKSEIKIDKGIPIPPPHKRERLAIWSKLEIGDSFVVQTKKEAKNKQSSAGHHGVKLTYRPQYDDTYRLWRVK